MLGNLASVKGSVESEIQLKLTNFINYNWVCEYFLIAMVIKFDLWSWHVI